MHTACHPHPQPSRSPLRCLLGALLFAFARTHNASAQTLPNRIPARIPIFHGETLTGQATDLPAAIEGKVGILILGFSRESRAPAAAWGKRLAADFDHSPNILYFELPVLEDVPRPLRGLVLRAIAHDLPAPAQAHFLPITSNQAEWKSAAHFADPNSAYVLVVDSSGTIPWQTSGDPTDERYTSLRQAVIRAFARPAPTP